MNYDNPIKLENSKVESNEPKPEKLFRGFVVNPDTLSADRFKEIIKPTETSGNDNNEVGVYMTDNLTMVECTNYSANKVGSIEVPRYDSGYGQRNSISLPGCGVILEIDTQNLSVREPVICRTLQGVYNNGFKGKEWISDSIPTEKYKVIELILSEGANDSNKFVIKLDGQNEEELKNAIDQIRKKFQERKEEIEEFKNFLLRLSEASRMSNDSWGRKWKEYKNSKNKDEQDLVFKDEKTKEPLFNPKTASIEQLKTYYDKLKTQYVEQLKNKNLPSGNVKMYQDRIIAIEEELNYFIKQREG